MTIQNGAARDMLPIIIFYLNAAQFWKIFRAVNDFYMGIIKKAFLLKIAGAKMTQMFTLMGY